MDTTASHWFEIVHARPRSLAVNMSNIENTDWIMITGIDLDTNVAEVGLLRIFCDLFGAECGRCADAGSTHSNKTTRAHGQVPLGSLHAQKRDPVRFSVRRYLLRRGSVLDSTRGHPAVLADDVVSVHQ